jgi:hypothetical protein
MICAVFSGIHKLCLIITIFRINLIQNDMDFEGDGYLFNVKSEKIKDEETGNEYACLLMYYIMDDNSLSKAYLKYSPYFYLLCKPNMAK